MLQELLITLFRCDEPFARLFRQEIPAAAGQALSRFWADPGRQDLAQAIGLPARDFQQLGQQLEQLGNGSVKAGAAGQWYEIAQASNDLAAEDPLAGAIAALYATAAWCGGIGDRLYFQPWEGYHPGWHVFPLILSQRLLAVDAVWSVHLLANHAAQFIESAKMAPWDAALREIVSQYRGLVAKALRRLKSCMGNLAWELRNACHPGGPNFRAEVAALLWTLGDVPHARLMTPADSTAYVPPLEVFCQLIHQAMLTMPADPLQQYIWLEMKDRPPLNLRDHLILFPRVNARYHGSQLHFFDEMMPVSPSQAFARAAVAFFRGDRQNQAYRDLLDVIQMHDDDLSSSNPAAYVRISALLNLTVEQNAQARDARWRSLAGYAASVVKAMAQDATDLPLGRILDLPFYYLSTEKTNDLLEALDAVEALRAGQLWYWLAITPPPPLPSGDHCAMLDHLEQEEQLLKELRGARFIRMLPNLPMHYRRYGFNLTDVDQPVPNGAQGSPDHPLRFNPFDANLALKEMRQAGENLAALYEGMIPFASDYVRIRQEPTASLDQFVQMSHIPSTPDS